MKVTIEGKTLLKALSHVQSVVERRNTIPILSNVLIQAIDEGKVILSTTDLDMEISEEVQAQVQAAGQITVPAATLHDIVRKMPAGAEVEIAFGKDDPRASVKSGRSRFQLPVLAAGDYPSMSADGMEAKIEIGARALASLIDRTRFAVSTEETRYYLNGLFLHPAVVQGVKLLRAVATDGHRLALAETPLDAADAPAVIVPRKTVQELRKLLDDAGETITLHLSKSKIHADLVFASLTSKVIDGSFPDYDRVIPKANPHLVKVDVELLAGAVDRVATISQEKARSMKVTVEHGRIALGVKNMDAGHAADELDAEYDGPALEVGFNARYVLDVCAQLKGETADIYLADPASPVLFLDPSDASARYVVMPLRV